jgi:hypothetical protein
VHRVGEHRRVLQVTRAGVDAAAHAGVEPRRVAHEGADGRAGVEQLRDDARTDVAGRGGDEDRGHWGGASG